MIRKTSTVIAIFVFASLVLFSQTENRETSVKKLITEFLDYAISGESEKAYAMFSEQVTSRLTKEQFEMMWKQLASQAGQLKKRGNTEFNDQASGLITDTELEYENMSLKCRLVFDSNDLISGMFFLPGKQPEYEFPNPPYAKIDNILEENVVINEKSEWPINATISFPKSRKPYPAVVLVHGSGPNDRDETIGPNKPFRDLAWGLASQGIAVMRYDKRTLAHANEISDEMTVWDETIDDAVASFEFLKQHKWTDSNRVFILGHSLGGYLMPRIAQKLENPKGLIYMAALARPLPETIRDQYEYIFSLDGEISDYEKLTLDSIKVQEERTMNPDLDSSTAPELLSMGTPAPYWIDLMDYDPVESAIHLEYPMLFLQGGRDYQVKAEGDFDKWKEALEGRSEISFIFYPAFNHLFFPGEGKCSPEEYKQQAHVDEKLIMDIAKWIFRQKY